MSNIEYAEECVHECGKESKSSNDNARAKPRRIREGRKGSWPQSQAIPVLAWICRLGSLRVDLLAVLLLLFLPMVVLGEASGDEPLSQNLTVQNERVAVFGSSWSSEPYSTHLECILGREVESFMYGGSGAGDVLPNCGMFKEDKFGVIVTDFGSWDRVQGLPWEQTENDLRLLFRCLKESGAVVVYNQIVPDSSGFGYHPYSDLAREEEVVLVPNTSAGICSFDPEVGRIIFVPIFDKGDSLHPNDEGKSVLAERSARVMLDVGLIHSAQTCEYLSVDVPSLLSRATDLMDMLEQKGGNTELARKRYALAEYLWENQYCYTANWSLQEKIVSVLELVLDHWDEISDMFLRANATIKETEEKNMDREVMLMSHDYSRADGAWAQYDCDATEMYLQKVLDRAKEIPEPVLLPILGFILLPALLWRNRWVIK